MNRTCLTGAVVLALALAGAARAQTGDHAVKVTNTGKMAIVALTTAEPGTNEWGADLLGAKTIGPGKTITVRIKGATCTVDFQAVMDDGKIVEKAGVEVCAEGAAVSL